MANNTSLHLVHRSADVAARRVAAPHRPMAFWHTVIGKKVVMAVNRALRHRRRKPLLILSVVQLPPAEGPYEHSHREQGHVQRESPQQAATRR